MGNKPDLRVSKTLRSINAAFMDLIVKKPVNEITVTELARRAEISKGTFYLHYLDIFDLYDKLVNDTAVKVAGSVNPYPDLFVDPESFIRIFMFEQIEPFSKILTISESALLSEKNIRFCSIYPQCFIDAIRMQIYSVGKLAPCEENDIKIEFLLTGILSIIIKYRPLSSKNIQQMDFIVRFLSAVIKETFPEFYGTHEAQP